MSPSKWLNRSRKLKTGTSGRGYCLQNVQINDSKYLRYVINLLYQFKHFKKTSKFKHSQDDGLVRVKSLRMKANFKPLTTFMFKQRTPSLEGFVDVIAITGMNHRSHRDIIYAVYSLLFLCLISDKMAFMGGTLITRAYLKLVLPCHLATLINKKSVILLVLKQLSSVRA